MSAFRTMRKSGCNYTNKGVTDMNSDAEAGDTDDKSDKHEQGANHTDAKVPDTVITTTSARIHFTDDVYDITEETVDIIEKLEDK